MIASADPLPSGLFDLEAFCGQLNTQSPIACCKSAISSATGYLHEQFHAGMEARALIELRARFMDALLGALWDRQYQKK